MPGVPDRCRPCPRGGSAGRPRRRAGSSPRGGGSPTWTRRFVPWKTSSRVTCARPRRPAAARAPAAFRADACAGPRAGVEAEPCRAGRRSRVVAGPCPGRGPAARDRGRTRPRARRAAAEERPEEVAEAGQVLRAAAELEADAARPCRPAGAGRTARAHRRRSGGRNRRTGWPWPPPRRTLVRLPVGAQRVVRRRFSGSPRTSLASLISLKRARRPRPLVHVRVVLARELAEGLLDVGLARRRAGLPGSCSSRGIPSARGAVPGAVTATGHECSVLDAAPRWPAHVGNAVGRPAAGIRRPRARRPAATSAVCAGSGVGLRRSAASRTWSIESTRTSLICLRISSGMSRRSFSFLRAGSPSSRPERCAARILLLRPPIGSTRPRSVISPVIADVLADRDAGERADHGQWPS